MNNNALMGFLLQTNAINLDKKTIVIIFFKKSEL